MSELADLTLLAQDLLTQSGLNSDIVSIETCAHGGNNRTYRLETASQVFALKQYFRKQDDIRDRLGAEYAFLKYATQAVPGMVPYPYAYNYEAGFALYEFVMGEPIKAVEINEKDVMIAAGFFCELNRSESRTLAELPNASEACFSITEHIRLIDARIEVLKQNIPANANSDLAQKLIQRLSEYWINIRVDLEARALSEGIAIDSALTLEDRCISPSDFGFHNALRQANGEIKFLDFEYAGWDDPAKMTGDFFSQLAVPVPESYFDQFTQTAMQPFPSANHLQRRAQLLRPLCQIKWCCIAMNIFIPVNLARRQFANPDLNVHELKAKQLERVTLLLQKLERCGHG